MFLVHCRAERLLCVFGVLQVLLSCFLCFKVFRVSVEVSGKTCKSSLAGLLEIGCGGKPSTV